ncbi:hypothetical protein [Algoriphagus sp.]|uniref:hypothetical protein n=1 Tax=Algoriphagus sp. TaxID=1872435 RepID=UPI002623C469|nr:hypothetical protein [Algoriphagus sp.]
MDKNEVIACHLDFFQDFGFLFQASEGIFYKQTSFGRQVIFIHYTQYDKLAYLEYNLAVRIDQVEEMIHPFLPTLRDYADRSLTLVQSIHHLEENLPTRFQLGPSLSLSEVLPSVEDFFVKKGFAWLDKFSNPQTLQHEFYSLRKEGFKSQNYTYHVFRSTALTKLFAFENYGELRTFFLSHLEHRGITPITLSSYLQFLNHLDQLD